MEAFCHHNFIADVQKKEKDKKNKRKKKKKKNGMWLGSRTIFLKILMRCDKTTGGAKLTESCTVQLACLATAGRGSVGRIMR